jgi:hypothetical protein
MERNHRCDIIAATGVITLILGHKHRLVQLPIGSLDKVVTRNFGLEHSVWIFKLATQPVGREEQLRGLIMSFPRRLAITIPAMLSIERQACAAT